LIEENADIQLPNLTDDEESNLIMRMQLILAEKRTSLSVLRTGFGVLTLPMSITALLVATSGFYEFANNLHLIVPLFLLNTLLVILGVTLIIRAWGRIKVQDKMINSIKKQAPGLSKLINEVGGKLI